MIDVLFIDFFLKKKLNDLGFFPCLEFILVTTKLFFF